MLRDIFKHYYIFISLQSLLVRSFCLLAISKNLLKKPYFFFSSAHEKLSILNQSNFKLRDTDKLCKQM